MDDSEDYMNVKFTKTDSRSPTQAESDVSYAELNVKTLSAARVRTDGDGLNSTYAELNFRRKEPHIDQGEDPPISSGPGGLSTTAQTGRHTEQPKDKIKNITYRKICILCLVTSLLTAIVAGLSIYVSQIRHSLITCDRDHLEFWEQYQEMNRTQRQFRLQLNELNSTLKSSITKNSRLALSRSTCLKNISVLNNNLSKLEHKLLVLENENSVLNTHLSDLNQTQTDLRQKSTDLEMKYRILTEEKAQICQMLTSRNELACPQDWVRNEDRCYFISTLETSYDEAKKYCSNIDARLLEINSKEEQKVISNAIVHQDRTYRIGKCEDGEEASSIFHKYSSGTSVCVKCDSYGWRDYCKRQHRFICEKSAHLCTDIPKKVRDLCQQSLGPT